MKNNMLISGCYLHSLNCKKGETDASYGVLKKINSQCKVFQSHFEFDHIINYYQTKSNFFAKIKMRLPLTSIAEKWNYDTKFNKYHFIYFRKNTIDYGIIRFFRKIKKNNPKCKIIFEIPTFPYDKEEFKTLKDLPFKIKDRINRKLLYKYVDVVTTFTSDEDYIFNIPTITMMNGVDVDSIPIKTKFNNNEQINIIVMSLFSHWHGFERLINGLNDYYVNGGERNINLYFVGEGVSITKYKELVNFYHLSNHVHLCGKLSGKDLDEIFDECNLACDSLGLHRLNLNKSSTLKSREYCARGLPLLCSSNVDFIDESFPYFLKLPSDDSNINFNFIINFFDKIYKEQNYDKIFNEIREYAMKKVDMSSTMMPIINYIKENCK